MAGVPKYIYRALVVRALWGDYICNSCMLQM